MSKTTNTKENGFEKHIVDHLINTNGYVLRTSKDYDNINCVDSELLFQFLDTTVTRKQKCRRIGNLQYTRIGN